jgi:hypothetical protein
VEHWRRKRRDQRVSALRCRRYAHSGVKITLQLQRRFVVVHLHSSQFHSDWARPSQPGNEVSAPQQPAPHPTPIPTPVPTPGPIPIPTPMLRRSSAFPGAYACMYVACSLWSISKSSWHEWRRSFLASPNGDSNEDVTTKDPNGNCG